MNYPDNFLNKVICGDSVSLSQYLPDHILDAVIIDPPYGESMGYLGDGSTREAESLLKSFLKAIEPKIHRNGHIAVFWTMRNLDICIESLKLSGFTYRRTLSMYIPKGGARPYLGWLPRTQAIVIGQKYLPKQPSEFHEELAQYLAKKLDESKITRSKIARQLGCDSRLVMKWTRVGDPSWCLPTPRFYVKLKEILNLDDRYDILLTRESLKPEGCGRDFEYKHDTYVITEQNGKMFHPSQKPLSVIKHIVTCLAPENGIVLDGFSGSGTTAIACKETNRKYIAIDISEEFCEIARTRLLKNHRRTCQDIFSI